MVVTKTVNDILTTAYECYEGNLGVEESASPEFKDKEMFFGNLITEKYTAPKGLYRGLHMSAEGEEQLCPIWTGIGWADAGYEFCKKLIKEFELEKDIILRPKKNNWVKKDTDKNENKNRS